MFDGARRRNWTARTEHVVHLDSALALGFRAPLISYSPSPSPHASLTPPVGYPPNSVRYSSLQTQLLYAVVRKCMMWTRIHALVFDT